MGFWKRTGWLALGIAPTLVVLLWQVIVSTVSLVVYVVYNSVMTGDSTLTMERYEELVMNFTDSSANNVNMFLIYIGYQIIFGLWYWLMFVRKKGNGEWKQVLKPQRILGIIGCGLALQLGLSMALTVLLPLFPKVQESYSTVMNALGSESVLMIVCVCILAPIGEELVFRGLSLRILKKAFPWWFAVALQAVLFGVYHLNPVQGIYATLLGLLLGYTAHRYGSVVPGILLHMAVNSSSYLITYLLPASLEENITAQIILMVIGFAAVAGLAIIYLKGVTTPDPTGTAAEATAVPVQNIESN